MYSGLLCPYLAFKGHSAIFRLRLSLFHVNSVSLRKESFSFSWRGWSIFGWFECCFLRGGEHLLCRHLLTPGSHCGPAWPWLSCLAPAWVAEHHLEALMMSRFCHACDLEDLTFCSFLISNLGLFWFTRNPGLYKAQKTLAAFSAPPQNVCIPQAPLGQSTGAIFIT